MTLCMPSTARNLSVSTASPSPPELAQRMPSNPAFASCLVSSVLSMLVSSLRNMLIIEITPSTDDFLFSYGALTLVTFAAQGVMKNTPISEGSIPIFSTAFFLAIFAATSMGDSSLIRLSIRLGNLTCISRTTAGQAEEIRGFLAPSSDSIFLVESETYSAALATSYTSSNPILRKVFSILFLLYSGLNWPYMVGAGMAILYLYCRIIDRSSVIAFGMVGADSDAFAAVYASFIYDASLAMSY